MKHVFKRLSPLVFFIFFTVSLPFVGFSQDYEVLEGNPPVEQSGSGGGGFSAFGAEDALEPDPGCDPVDPGCPIDGGLSALLVIGAGYGIRKVRQARKTVEN